MSGARWIRVSPGRYNEPGEVRLDITEEGASFISPFDIPRYVRGHYDEDRRRLMIEFEYIGRERVKKIKSEGPLKVTTSIGRKTGRIFGFDIEIPVLDATTFERCHDAVDHAISDVRRIARQEEPWSSRRLSPQVVGRVLEDSKNAVFAGVR